MSWRLSRTLLWIAIGLVAGSFVLAVVGEETTSSDTRGSILHWHEWLGLLSLPTLIASLAAWSLDKRAARPLMPHWLPHIRRTLQFALYGLLVLQPFSGWLLASHEGKLTSFFGWTLPTLASPNSTFAEYGYIYHGIGGALILIVAILSVRLNLTAFVYSLIRGPRKRRRALRDARKIRSDAPR